MGFNSGFKGLRKEFFPLTYRFIYQIQTHVFKSSSETKRDVERTDNIYFLNTQCTNVLFQRRNFVSILNY